MPDRSRGKCGYIQQKKVVSRNPEAEAVRGGEVRLFQKKKVTGLGAPDPP
jgi:hypothetical protein